MQSLAYKLVGQVEKKHSSADHISTEALEKASLRLIELIRGLAN